MKKTIGDKITASVEQKELIIKIPGTMPKWMEHALLSWIILWGIMGVYVFYYVLTSDLPEKNVFFFSAYLAFWAYFFWKSLYAYLFKKFGFELIAFDKDFLHYKRSIFSYGKVKKYKTSNIREFIKTEHDPKSFGQAYQKSFWVIGNERIQFQFLEKRIGLGMHLNEQETKSVKQLLNQHLKKIR